MWHVCSKESIYIYIYIYIYREREREREKGRERERERERERSVLPMDIVSSKTDESFRAGILWKWSQ